MFSFSVHTLFSECSTSYKLSLLCIHMLYVFFIISYLIPSLRQIVILLCYGHMYLTICNTTNCEFFVSSLFMYALYTIYSLNVPYPICSHITHNSTYNSQYAISQIVILLCSFYFCMLSIRVYALYTCADVIFIIMSMFNVIYTLVMLMFYIHYIYAMYGDI
jgi:hypothetical protein